MNYTCMHIPKPCNAKWDDMTPTDQGRYCQLCQKEVIDFTDGNQTRLAKFWKERNGQVCGRVNAKDLKPPMSVWLLEQRPRFSRFKSMMMALVAAVGLGYSSNAQTTLDQAGGRLLSQSWKVEKGVFLHYTGLIRDNHTQEPLERAGVVLMDGDRFLAGSYSDAEGKFLLQVPREDLEVDSLTLKIRYLNHVFIREGIAVSSQDLTIDLNSTVWLEQITITDAITNANTKESVLRTEDSIITGGMIGRIIFSVQGPQLSRYDTLEEWIWMNHSDVFSDDF